MQEEIQRAREEVERNKEFSKQENERINQLNAQALTENNLIEKKWQDVLRKEKDLEEVKNEIARGPRGVGNE